MKHLKITVKGTVQGVGFRPFVYTLATRLGLKGRVNNTSHGVVIDVEGEAAGPFPALLRSGAPPLARIDSIETEELPIAGYKDFIIMESSDSGSFTHVPPDISVCNDCLGEMLDSSDRRYLYPFINCTNCGPRYSITKKVPYDRPNTTMSVFGMCPQCLTEYHNPADRRFHAQPDACPECGPRIEVRVCNQAFGKYEKSDALGSAINLLKHGAIVAIKGLGGFHLACDAANEDAVRLLRERKRRSNKPFAVMAPDVESVRKFCLVSEEEERLLNDRRRPVVLLKKRPATGLPDAVAPGNKHIGFMLPYTPLHYLLFNCPGRTADFDALVMTSGNLSEEPIVVENEEALSKLSGIADAFLLHDRDIFMRVDDSVVKAAGTGLSFVRRSRGYVPSPILLPDHGPDVLACGADLKNTFTLTKGDAAIVSQHIGDMENLETLDFFEESLDNLRQVYRAAPAAIAYDLHPNYMSSQWALRHGNQNRSKTYGIQHHYAHIASVMAEKGLKEKVIGVALDGTGYGTDANLWGGEFLVCDMRGFTRAAHFRYVPLPGGESSIKECWKTAVSYVAEAAGTDEAPAVLDSIGFAGRYGRSNIGNVLKLISNRRFSPLSSGAGRLFDAVSALAGICDTNTFEGEAAIALESLVAEGTAGGYGFDLLPGCPMVVDFSKTILDIIADLKRNEYRGTIAARFHNTVVGVIKEVVRRTGDIYGIKTVALSGGVFQNTYLIEKTCAALSADGFEVHINEKVPCNDGGISLGQAYILRESLK